MKGLLNNKWFVLALGGAALAMAAINIVSPLLDSGAGSTPDDVAPFGMDISTDLQSSDTTRSNPENVFSEDGVVPGSGAHVNEDLYKIGWKLDSPRDPFTQFSNSASEPRSPDLVASAPPVGGVSESSVTAIAFANNIRMAVVNGKLVQLNSPREFSQAAQIISQPREIRNSRRDTANLSLAKEQ